jgi:hypothetical protein
VKTIRHLTMALFGRTASASALASKQRRLAAGLAE